MIKPYKAVIPACPESSFPVRCKTLRFRTSQNDVKKGLIAYYETINYFSERVISMFTKLFSLIIIIGLCSSPALAAEPKGSSLADWIKVVQKKIDKIVPKKIQPLSTGASGIRGTKEDASVKLYWKGKKSDELVTEDEMKEFKSAVDLIVKDDRAAAVTVLEKFLKQYPDSALIPDAKKILDLLKVETVAEKR
jgi:TolA-binding protein